MTKILCSILLFIATSSTLAAPSTSPQHYHVLKKIAEYVNASERCRNDAQENGLPRESIIGELRKYDPADVERFLIARGTIMQEKCEWPELTELAYTILTYEDVELEKDTQDAIAAIKVLAFPSTVRKAKQIYQSLPEDMRHSLEKFEYFNQPFDDEKVYDLLHKQ